MSKSIYIRVLLLMALALSAACEKEVDNPSPSSEVQIVHYKATVQTGIDSKATVEGLKYKFEEGDQVYLESEDGNLYGFLSMSVDDVGKNVARFEGDLKYKGEAPFFIDALPVNLVLVSKEDYLHTIENGKVKAVTTASYLSDKWAPSIEAAVSHMSHFTGSGDFNDVKFTLYQQSGFLKCAVRMRSVNEAPAGSTITARLFNNNILFREASIKVSEAGSVPFVFAYLGGEVSLDNATLVLSWVEGEDTKSTSFDVANCDKLAANNYYTISRSTLSYDGFKIKATENTVVTFNYSFAEKGIEYSLDYGDHWHEYTTKGAEIPLQAEEVLCVRGTGGTELNYKNDSELDSYGTPGQRPIFVATKLCFISGNIMSLLSNAEDHSFRTELSKSAFQGAFSRGKEKNTVTYIDIDSKDPLILPVTTLIEQCYMQMFRNCTSLTTAPKFTVQGTAKRCCYNMFRDCSGLSNVNLIDLPADKLTEDCYRELFRLCTSLTGVRSDLLPASTLAKACYQQMFNGCSALTQFPNLPAATLAVSCYDTMFALCTSITTAPVLSATKLVSGCYVGMFNGCSALTSITCLATEGVNANNTKNWVSGVGSSGKFTKAANVTWPQGVNGIPSGWDVEEYTGN